MCSRETVREGAHQFPDLQQAQAAGVPVSVTGKEYAIIVAKDFDCFVDLIAVLYNVS